MLPGPSGKAPAGPRCVARRGQRCQGFVCDATPVPEMARMQRAAPSHPASSPTPTHTPYHHADLHPLTPLPACMFTFYSRFILFFLFECVYVRDWRCPLCHLQQTQPPPPPFPPPNYLPLFPLVTRVGLTICVPVCSHSGKKKGVCGGGGGSLSGQGGGNGGCISRHIIKAHCAEDGDTNEQLTSLLDSRCSRSPTNVSSMSFISQ